MDIEQKEKKKQRILKIIKYVGISCFLLAIILIAIGSCKKTHAEEMEIDYRNYNLLVSIEDSTLTGGIYEGHLVVVAKIESNQLDYVSIDLSYPDFSCDSADLLSGPYETYGASEISSSNLYYIQSEQDYPSANYTIIAASEYNTYMQWNNGGMYDAGYGIGIDTTNVSEAYNEGYNAGLQNAQENYTNQLNTQAESYQATIDTLQQDIQYYEGIINSGTTPWGSFTSLLGTIFLFPIKFFKEGFNIDLFGVNIGGLIIGIGLIGIILAVIGLILGKRGKE